MEKDTFGIHADLLIWGIREEKSWSFQLHECIIIHILTQSESIRNTHIKIPGQKEPNIDTTSPHSGYHTAPHFKPARIPLRTQRRDRRGAADLGGLHKTGVAHNWDALFFPPWYLHSKMRLFQSFLTRDRDWSRNELDVSHCWAFGPWLSTVSGVGNAAFFPDATFEWALILVVSCWNLSLLFSIGCFSTVACVTPTPPTSLSPPPDFFAPYVLPPKLFSLLCPFSIQTHKGSRLSPRLFDRFNPPLKWPLGLFNWTLLRPRTWKGESRNVSWQQYAIFFKTTILEINHAPLFFTPTYFYWILNLIEIWFVFFGSWRIVSWVCLIINTGQKQCAQQA